MDARLASEALRRALASEYRTSIPHEPAALRFFVTGALRRVVVEELGVTHFDLRAGSLARQVAEAARSRQEYSSGTRFRRVEGPKPETSVPGPGTQPPPPAVDRVHRVLVVSLDPGACDALERRLGPGTAVTRAESLFDFAPLLELRADRGGAVVVDAPLSPIALPVLVRSGGIIPPECPVVVVGVSARDWARFSALFPPAAEWVHVEHFDDLDPAHLSSGPVRSVSHSGPAPKFDSNREDAKGRSAQRDRRGR